MKDSKHIAGELGGGTYPILSLSDDGTYLTLYKVPETKEKLIVYGDKIKFITVQERSLSDFIYKNGKKSNRYFLGTAIKDSNGNGDGSVTIKLVWPLKATGDYATVDRLPIKDELVEILPSHYSYLKIPII